MSLRLTHFELDSFCSSKRPTRSGYSGATCQAPLCPKLCPGTSPFWPPRPGGVGRKGPWRRSFAGDYASSRRPGTFGIIADVNLGNTAPLTLLGGKWTSPTEGPLANPRPGADRTQLYCLHRVTITHGPSANIDLKLLTRHIGQAITTDLPFMRPPRQLEFSVPSW